MEATGPAAVAVVQAIQATAVGKPPVGGTAAAGQPQAGLNTAQEEYCTKQPQETGQSVPTSDAVLEDEPGGTEGDIFLCYCVSQTSLKLPVVMQVAVELGCVFACCRCHHSASCAEVVKMSLLLGLAVLHAAVTPRQLFVTSADKHVVFLTAFAKSVSVLLCMSR